MSKNPWIIRGAYAAALLAGWLLAYGSSGYLDHVLSLPDGAEVKAVASKEPAGEMPKKDRPAPRSSTPW